MSAAPGQPASSLSTTLQRAHRVALGLLALCAIVIVLQERVDPEPAPHRTLTVWVVGLAFVAVAGRLFARSPVAADGLRAAASALGYLAALGIGAIAVRIALADGAVWTALAYTAAAALLGLRLPPSLGAGDAERRLP